MESKPNLHQRMNAVMRDVRYIQKDHDMNLGGRSFKVITHDKVTGAIRGSLVEHGIVYYPQNILWSQSGNRTELSMDVRFVNVDDPQDHIDVPTFGFGIGNDDKGPGKCLSYCVKYGLLKAFGLETGEDTDLDANVEYQPDIDQAALQAAVSCLVDHVDNPEAQDLAGVFEIYNELSTAERFALGELLPQGKKTKIKELIREAMNAHKEAA